MNDDRERLVPFPLLLGVQLAGAAITFAIPMLLMLLFRPCSAAAIRGIWITCLAFVPVILVCGFSWWRTGELWRALRRTAVWGAIFFFAAVIVIPNSFGALERGRQQRTMAQLREIGKRFESKHASSGYPAGTSTTAKDAFGFPIRIFSRRDRYLVVSCGECGVPDVTDPWTSTDGTTTSFAADIVYSNGAFIRWPEGPQQ